VYRDRLAVQLSERVIIYEPSGDNEEMHYRIKEKLLQSLECNLLVVTTNNLILYLDKRLQSLTFEGIIEREWILDSPICYIKIVGGPTGQERLLTGLKNGQIMEIYLDNPFPTLLATVDGAVRCVDISSMKEKLAVVSDHGILSVFNIYNDKKLQEFRDVTSVAFNTAFEDMMCFSGQDYLAIKVANFSEYKQKFSGIIVGLNGSKMYCLHGSLITTIEVNIKIIIYYSFIKIY
jgi:intraflagellar transport protein 122